MQAPEALLSKLTEYGATFIEGTYTTGRAPFQFLCNCGTIVSSKNWNNLRTDGRHALCEPCARKRIAAKKVKDYTLDIVAKCSLFGSIPDLSTYVDSKTPFSTTCSCGNTFSATWNNLHREDRRATCSACSYVALGEASLDLNKTALLAELAIHKGATLLSRSADSLTYLCSCGEEVSIHGGSSKGVRAEQLTFMCRKCSRSYFSGPNHPNWNPERLDSDRTERHYDPRYSIWVKEVLRSNDYTCAISGRRGGKLAAHHLFNWADHPELRFEVTNGIPLDPDLHKEFHHVYGRKHNTLEQFREFFLSKTGRSFSQ